ncbi:hypothetical protein [Cryptosporangium sp. NPDC048952]
MKSHGDVHDIGPSPVGDRWLSFVQDDADATANAREISVIGG